MFGEKTEIKNQSKENNLRILVISQYFYPENFRINDLCYGLLENCLLYTSDAADE